VRRNWRASQEKAALHAFLPGLRHPGDIVLMSTEHAVLSDFQVVLQLKSTVISERALGLWGEGDLRVHRSPEELRLRHLLRLSTPLRLRRRTPPAPC
jgi:hypothetical protein